MTKGALQSTGWIIIDISYCSLKYLILFKLISVRINFFTITMYHLLYLLSYLFGYWRYLAIDKKNALPATCIFTQLTSGFEPIFTTIVIIIAFITYKHIIGFSRSYRNVMNLSRGRISSSSLITNEYDCFNLQKLTLSSVLIIFTEMIHLVSFSPPLPLTSEN